MNRDLLEKVNVFDREAVKIPNDIADKIMSFLHDYKIDMAVFFKNLIWSMFIYSNDENELCYIDAAGLKKAVLTENNGNITFLDLLKSDICFEDADFQNLPPSIYTFGGIESLYCTVIEKKIASIISFPYEGESMTIEAIYKVGSISKDEILFKLHQFVELALIVCRNPNEKFKEVILKNEVYDNYELMQFSERTIIDVLDENVREYGDRIALEDENSSYTYKELDDITNRMAAFLIRRYNPAGKRVAIYMERTADYVISIIALLKCRCAYVPINLAFPQEKIKYIFQSCDPCLVIKDKRSYIETDCETLSFDLEMFALEEIIPCDKPLATDLAYIIYTSGTTGQPKGAMISHRNVANMEYHFKYDLGIKKEDSVGQYASFSFDASVSEMFMALFCGARLYIIEEKFKNNLLDFQKCINETKITVITLPPAYSRFVDFGQISSLRLLLTAGAECDERLYRKISEHCEVVNAYGPTECTVCATTWHGKKNSYIHNSVPIGKAIPNVSVYVVNQWKKPLPFYIKGEICIGGNSVGNGYWNNEELTSQKFVGDIFDENMRMYCTGDMGRMMPDGTIEFCGRKDDLVKINGIRIELAEINEAVFSISGIENAASWVEQNQSAKIILCYETSDDHLVPREVRKLLLKKIPVYMVPHQIVKVDKLELNINGKVDKGKLLQYCDDNIIEEARNAEYEFETIFHDVLENKALDIDLSFLQNGASSIDAIRIISKFDEQFGINVSPNLFYQSDTLRELYKRIGDILINKGVDEEHVYRHS